MSTHGKDVYFAIEDSAGTTLRNMSPYLDSVDFNQKNDTHDDTTYGKTGHTYRGGLTDSTFSISGMFDRTLLVGPHTVLQTLVGLSSTVGFEYGPEGNVATKLKLSGECVMETYAVSAPVADLIKFTASFKISNAVTAGVFP